ncbi:complex I subunit 1 family protein [Staphylothermus hellenicus]|uniref:Respiratory-chain NADH dehydrogenase subunit 1 n=1 Tax=Staphylothermus hellenicus (strain DSM 12710 / JCM 10830 / BK20S6-10-b1 / P8) TaxID=591019 RepID=D7DAT0_STAHD|nr:complex I subunit 1 family protein [Staphylothermus hellenicus]ADI31277.1 respiratory-chain NADH dehydrogenase subunit 1 [Staphylothermus hellenicus DSM 12710]
MTWGDLGSYTLQSLLYPGLLFIIIMIIFTQWIYRKVAGRVQYRRGPTYVGPFGLLQPFADLMKLLLKEDVVSRYSAKIAPVIIAALGVGAITVLTLMTPLAYDPVHAPFDIILFFYLALWASLSIMFLGLATPNPYTSLGVGRYMALLVSAEPAYISSFLVPVIIASKIDPGVEYSLYRSSLISYQLWTDNVFSLIAMIIAAIAGFLAMMGILEIKPFDFPEAEGEIYWGIFTEYGGPRLALAFFILFAERIVVPIIYVLLFLGGSWPIDISTNYIGGLLVIFAKFIVVFILLSVIDNVMPRFKPTQGVRFLWKYPVTLAIAALIIALLI